MELKLDETTVEELYKAYVECKSDSSYWHHLAYYLVAELKRSNPDKFSEL